MSKGSTSSDAPFGTLLGYAPGGVAIYSSNYSSLNPQDYPDDATFRSYIGNEYMGHKWQCVEFARRFLFLTYGFVFTDVGMAYEIFSCVFCAKWSMTIFCRCRRSPTAPAVRRSPARC
jgi:glutathionylspermidine amidase/synthetase